VSAFGAGSILGVLISGFLEKQNLAKQQRIADLKERLDNFYSPLIYHFENMRSWAKAHKSSQRYAFAKKTLEAKIGDMNNLMRLGLRYGSAKVRDLWYEWQPFAVAAVEVPQVYPNLADSDEFLDRTERLHEALEKDCNELLVQYWIETGRTGGDRKEPHSKILTPLKRLSERRRDFVSLFLSVFAGAELGAGTSLLVDWEIRNGYQSTLGGAVVLFVTAAATLVIVWAIYK
jgi:hypothetical protein